MAGSKLTHCNKLGGMEIRMALYKSLISLEIPYVYQANEASPQGPRRQSLLHKIVPGYLLQEAGFNNQPV